MIDEKLLERISDNLSIQYEQLRNEILLKLKSRSIKLISDRTWIARQAVEVGIAKDEVVAMFAKAEKITLSQAKDMFDEAGISTIKLDNLHVKGHELPLKISSKQARIINAGLRKVNADIRNMTGTIAKSAGEIFELATTQGYNMVTSGAFTLSQADNKIGRMLLDQGLNAVEYPSGTVSKLETAVPRAVRTGVQQTMNELSQVNAEEMGTDLVEVTAHEGARPSHALWQGQIYSRSGKSNKYPPLSDTGYGTVEGLGGANCRHTFFPYFEEASEPEYTKQDLKDFREEEVLYNGEKISLYDANQKMRGFERDYRKLASREMLTGESTKINRDAILKKRKELFEQTGAKPDPEKLKIYKRAKKG